MMVIENKYHFGDTVYLKTDPEQLPRLVTSFEIFKAGEILYKLIQGTSTSSHYDFEISTEKDLQFNAIN